FGKTLSLGINAGPQLARDEVSSLALCALTPPDESVGLQHSFHVFAHVHTLETILPAIERRHLTDDWPEMDLSGAQHGHDFFPILERVAEAPLKSHGLLDEGVKGKIQRLGPPPYFGDLPAWTHNFERDLERRRCARRINHQVGAKSVPHPAEVFPHVHILNVHGLGGAKHSCHREPRPIPRRSGNNQGSCAGLPGHPGAKETDRAGADYNYGVPSSNLAFHGHGVIGDTTRFGQRGALKGKRVRYVVQAAGWHADVVSHRSMRSRAEPRTFGAQIVFPGAAIDALAAD